MPRTQVNFIGCGRLGKTIASLLVKNQAATIRGVVNSSLASSNKAIRFIGQGKAFEKISKLPPADIYFITTHDDIIQRVCDELAIALKSGAIVVHCSGALSSDVLKKVEEYNCYAVSIHPIKSFANLSESINTFAGTYCTIEGNKKAANIIIPLFEKIGGKVLPIHKENKKFYHIGGVLANNYFVTLHYYALQCYIAAGIPKVAAEKIVATLITEPLNNIKLGHEKILTGPLSRGDSEVIKEHIAVLENRPILKNLYVSLGQGALPLTHHTDAKKEELEKILTLSPSSR